MDEILDARDKRAHEDKNERCMLMVRTPRHGFRISGGGVFQIFC